MSLDFAGIGGSALTDKSLQVPEAPSRGIPATYVPARNTALMALALAWAEVLDARAIFIGANARDYSVCGDARIWVRLGTRAQLMRIRELCDLPEASYETLAVDMTSLGLAWKRVLGRHKHDTSGKRCFRVRLERGQEIDITEDHSLFTIDEEGCVGPVRGSSIIVGMPLVVPFDLSISADAWASDLDVIDLRQFHGIPSNRRSSVIEDAEHLTNRLRRTRIPLRLPVTDDFLRIVGLWLAEGGKDPDSKSRALAISIGGVPGAPSLLRGYFAGFGISVHKSPANDFDYRIDSSVAYEVFRRLDLFGTAKSGRKCFPAWFWSLSQRQRRVLVAGLWDGDGCTVWNGEAPIFQKSHEIIDELYHCLTLDGIFPTVKPAHYAQKRLAITRAADFERFVTLYPLWHVAKLESLRRAATVTGRDKTTGLWKCAGLWAAVAGAELAPGRKTEIYNRGGKYDVSVRARRSVFTSVPSLKALAESQLAFLRVTSIEPVEHKYMYDLSVDGAHNFLANGVLAHNSGYPDCRPEFIAAFQALARLATKQAVEGRAVRIEAPLINMSKADIIRRGAALGVDFAQTVSCYNADAQGRACGRCDSCRLRREGFRAAGIHDPTRYA
jgi:7-cyano-7-deazaguanine synthase in queuosine biosynthesis/intein/homing endonuclease